MGYEIDQRDGFFEITLSGDPTKFEILNAFAELVRRDPQKRYPDIWIVAPEVRIPYMDYSQIAGAIASVHTKPTILKKSAIVAADAFQKAQLELFREEMSSLPLDLQVFQSRDEAVAWIKSPETQPSPDEK
jgi:hypothetical protein